MRGTCLAVVAAVIVSTAAFLFVSSAFGNTSVLNAPTGGNITYDELRAMPRSTEYAELDCYGVPVSKGNWTGVRLGLVLGETMSHQNAKSIEFYASDGYATTLSFSDALQGNVIIAYELNGSPLPEKTRLVLPSMNGSEWISDITRIKIFDLQGNYSFIYLNG